MISYKGDVTKLGRAETWFLAAAKIPRLTARLNNFLFTLQFKQSVKDLKASAGTIRKVSRQHTLPMLAPTTQRKRPNTMRFPPPTHNASLIRPQWRSWTPTG